MPDAVYDTMLQACSKSTQVQCTTYMLQALLEAQMFMLKGHCQNAAHSCTPSCTSSLPHLLEMHATQVVTGAPRWDKAGGGLRAALEPVGLALEWLPLQPQLLPAWTPEPAGCLTAAAAAAGAQASELLGRQPAGCLLQAAVPMTPHAVPPAGRKSGAN